MVLRVKRDSSRSKVVHKYEKNQQFNGVTRVLHLTRYRNLEKIVGFFTGRPGGFKVVDIGCGVAKAYETIKNAGADFSYLGIELEQDYVKIAANRYGQFSNFSIIHGSIENHFDEFDAADLIIGLESFEHIPEPLVVRTTEAIGKSKFEYLYVTVPNEIGPAILAKNVGSFLMGYGRYREYTWRETMAASFYNLEKVARHGTGHKGFDWRWLGQTIRQNCRIEKITVSPLPIVPKFLSPSIGFLCKNDIGS